MYLERLKLDGRRALVTGGASGIGLACVEALGEMGAAVTIADLKLEQIDAAIASLRAKGLDAESVVMDVTDSEAVTGIADRMGASRCSASAASSRSMATMYCRIRRSPR